MDLQCAKCIETKKIDAPRQRLSTHNLPIRTAVTVIDGTAFCESCAVTYIQVRDSVM